MSTIINEVCNRLGCEILERYLDSNGYQGTNYYLLVKDGKYSLTNYTFGTCALCDTFQALTEEWLNEHPDCGYGDVPLEAYEFMVKAMVSEAKDCGWCTSSELNDKLHMLVGLSYSDEMIEPMIRLKLKEVSNGS